MIRLTMLGSVRVGGSGGDLTANGSQQAKRVALLAYLAVARPRGAQRRDTMLGLLWPELDQERARAALRQALHGIRKSLGAECVLSHGTELLELNAGMVACDCWEVEAAAKADDWNGIVRGYQGELLAGLFVADVPEFEAWADAERARMREVVRESAWRIADAHASHSETGAPRADIVAAVRLATSLSGFDESAIRRGMRLLAAHGASAEAMALFQRFSADVKRELEIEPSSETVELAAQVRRQTAAAVMAVEGRNEKLAATTAVVADAVIPAVASANASPAAPSTVASSGAPSNAPLNDPGAFRPRASRLSVRKGAVSLAAAVVALLAAARLAPSANAVADPRRVSVAEFRGDGGSVDTIAQRVSSEVRAALAAMDGARVLAADVTGDRALNDAGTIVRGAVHVDEGVLELRGEIVDVATGAIVRTVVERGSPGVPLRVLMDEFNDRLAAALSTALYPGWGNALSQPPSYAGYRSFVSGMRRIKAEDHESAIASFQHAFAEDSSFTAAGLLAGMELYQVGRFAAADSLARCIAQRRATLPPVDERLLEWLVRSLQGDRLGARGAMQGVVALAPAADLAWLQLAIDNVETARPAEALAALDHIAPEAEFGEAWPAYWATRLEALHLLGDHARELTVARDGLARHPETGILANYELRALAALGRVDDVARAIDAGAARTPDPEATLRQVGRELIAHGHAARGAALLERALEQHASRPDSVRASVEQRGIHARTLYLLDRRASARAVYDSILRERPGCISCIAALGVLAARSGNRAEAMTYDSSLARVTKPFFFGTIELMRARIASALGDVPRAASLVNQAFAAGAEYDVLTHADADLAAVKPDSIYRAFARAR